MTESVIPDHGGYKNLASYQKTGIIYDATVQFCARFLDKRDRTHDQMIQAARSGKQNIIEGSMASGTSRETEIKLTQVARSSLEELLEDYRDFLRTRDMPVWAKDSKEARFVRELSRKATPLPERGKPGTHETSETHETKKANTAPKPGPTPAPDSLPSPDSRPSPDSLPSPDSRPPSHPSHSSHLSHSLDPSHPSHSPYDYFRPFIETRPPEVVANILLCLIHQANYLLDQQIRHQEKTFLEHGGFREAMTRARLAERDKQRRRTP